MRPHQLRLFFTFVALRRKTRIHTLRSEHHPSEHFSMHLAESFGSSMSSHLSLQLPDAPNRDSEQDFEADTSKAPKHSVKISKVLRLADFIKQTQFKLAKRRITTKYFGHPHTAECYVFMEGKTQHKLGFPLKAKRLRETQLLQNFSWQTSDASL